MGTLVEEPGVAGIGLGLSFTGFLFGLSASGVGV